MKQLGPEYQAVTHAPLTAGDASLPQLDGEQVPISSVLPPEWRQRVETGDGVVLVGPVKPVRVFHGVATEHYGPVVARCVGAGVAEYVTKRPLVINGLFGVAKPDNTVRVILEARLANVHFCPPPDAALPCIESLSRIAVPSGSRLWGGLLDLDQYYHRLVLPEWVRDYFGLPEVTLATGERVWVRWRTCPMGWSWAVFLAQLAHTWQLERGRTCGFRSATQLRRPVVRCLRGSSLAMGVYIDDAAVLGAERRAVNRALRGVRLAEAVKVKESKYQPARPNVAVRIWGVVLDADGCFRPEAGRLAGLLKFTVAVLATTAVAPSLLQRLVGKWVWILLLIRPLLSICRPLFKQARSNRRRVFLWASSREALSRLVQLAPLVCVNPARPVGRVFATDSSGRGGGVCLAGARHEDDFWALGRLVYYKGRDDLHEANYRSEVGRLVQACSFGPGFGWRWRDPREIIMVKEGRAFFTGLHRVTCAPGGLGVRHLALVDNTSVVGAVTKGTSSHPVLNAFARRLAALTLATGTTVDLVWCPTALQPADAPSRCSP